MGVMRGYLGGGQLVVVDRVFADRAFKVRVEVAGAEALLTLHERHSLERFGFARFVGSDESLYVEFGKILE